VLVRFSIIAIAVLCAAALGHGFIAALTRAGIVVGPFGTYAHETLVPLLLTAAIIAGVTMLGLFGDALARAGGDRGDWLAQASTQIARASSPKLALTVFVLQLLVLSMMEAVEQAAAFGHPLGLGAALGAPLAIGLAVHAFAMLLVLGAVILATRGIAAAAQALARAIGPAIRRLLVGARSTARAARRAFEIFSEVSLLTPLAWRIANRPPPTAAL
jgi:hypothetical protein